MIAQGHCLKLLKELEPCSVDMVLADLPYGTTRSPLDSVINLPALWYQYRRVVKPNGAILLHSVMPFSAILWYSNPSMWRYEWVWRKNGVSRFLDAKSRPLLDYENVQVFYAAEPTFNPQMQKGERNHGVGRAAGNKALTEIYEGHNRTATKQDGLKFPRLVLDLVLDFDKVPPGEVLHPFQKPVPLLAYLIATYTNPGDVVLDNTMGSGSAGVACHLLGRKFIGMEKDHDVFRIAEKRLREIEKSPLLF